MAAELNGGGRLHEAARTAQAHAYAPHSQFSVGAALETERGGIFAGCNVENASYGLTICAERAAVFAAVTAEGPSMRITRLVVICGKDEVGSLCGACRQVVAEFGPRARIVYRSPNGEVEATIDDLLPDRFTMDATRTSQPD